MLVVATLAVASLRIGLGSPRGVVVAAWQREPRSRSGRLLLPATTRSRRASTLRCIWIFVAYDANALALSLRGQGLVLEFVVSPVRHDDKGRPRGAPSERGEADVTEVV